MATKVKPSRLQVSGAPQVGQVPVYVDEDTFQWGAGGGGGASFGRFLSLWDSTTGKPISFPEATPYNYITGDYFIVEVVSSATPPVNYRPDGSTYTGSASSVTESDEVEVGDTYVYDGTTWLLQSNHGKTVTFSNIAGSPYDNTNLSNALGLKQDTLTTQTAYTSKGTSTKVPTITTNTLGQVTAITETNIAFPVTSVNGSTGAVVLDADDISDSTTTNKFVTQNDKDSWDGKQDELVSSVNIRTINGTSILGSGDIVTPTGPTYSAGTGIGIAADTISNTGVTSFNGSTGAVTYTAPVTSVNGQIGAVTIQPGITKIFTLADTSDLTTAQAAYDRYVNGGNPIINIPTSAAPFAGYVLGTITATQAVFFKANAMGAISSGTWGYYQSAILTLSSGAVTAITKNSNLISIASTTPTGVSNNTITLVI